jgi:hypothetical protein
MDVHLSTPIAPRQVVRKPALLVLPLIVSFVVVSLQAQGVWGTRGISRRFVVSGSRLFAAEGRGVAVYDLETTTRLEAATRDDETTDVAMLGQGEVVSLTAAGIDRWMIQPNGRLSLKAAFAQRGLSRIAATATLVAAASDRNVFFYSTADGVLEPAGSMLADASINAMTFHGDTLVLGLESVGVQLIDPSNPTALVSVPEAAKDLAFSGNTLYLAAGGDGIVVISLDGTPHVIGRFGAGEANITRIAASGSRVFAVEGDQIVHIYDATNPAALAGIGTLAAPATAIAAIDTSLYLGGMPVDSSGLPSGPGVPLEVFDASQPGAPRELARIGEVAVPVSGVTLSPAGSLAYVVDRPYLRVLDVSRSAAPKQLASLLIDNIQDHIRINASGTRVVLYNRGDVQLVDVTNPYAPKLLNVWHSLGRPPSRAGFLHDLVIEANWTTGFHVLDFDHYNPPGLVGYLKMDYHELAIKTNADTAYIAAERSSLAPVDLRNPNHPLNPTVLLLWMQEGVFADANDQHADLLLVRTPDGVHILDLANPLQPVDAGKIPSPDATAMAAAGETLYIAGDGLVASVDLTRSTQPVIGGPVMRATAPGQMAAAGGKLVIADTYSVRVYGPDTAPVPPPEPPSHPRAARP